MKRAVVIITVVLSLAAATAARAQGARVVGTIVDPMQAVLPGVTVTADHVDPAERSTTTVKTGRDGRFEFADLRPGSYTLTASLPGFETFRTEMTLNAGDDRERAIELQVGSLQETITVTMHDTPAPPHQASVPRESPPPARRAPVPGAIRVGGNIKPPAKTYDVRPVYPAALADKREEGHVDLLATIGGDGSVRDIKIVSSPNPDFANAASSAVSQWQFTPTLLNGSPIDVHMRVAVNFTK